MENKSNFNIQESKIAFLTLGCKVNSYETEAMQALLVAAGATVVEFNEVADIYVVNTCSVTNMADRKSRQMLHRAKKKNPDAVVVAAGCYAQTADETAMKETGIDVIIGNNQKKQIVEILKQYMAGAENKRLEIGKETEYEDLSLDTQVEHTRAYIKIQDGCNQFCSYCIIPYARGRIRSRNPQSVLEEVKRLAENGYQEIVLTGIHLSSYGRTSYEKMTENSGQPLLELIQQLNEVEGIKRIRLGSLEPRIITEKFVKTLCECEKVCPQFHLSLQSGSDTVLARMNRKYTTEEYAASVDILKKYYDTPAITTDIIVGFPQETEAEFTETMEFAKRIGFSKIHVFKYSRRKGTVADKMPGQVDEQVKNERSDKLMALEEALGEAYRNQFIGKAELVLFEECTMVDGEVCQVGYNERYVRIAAKSGEDCSNCIKSVKITGKAREQETLTAEM
ncbi:MAG: tRNA (N(6)-L-threonylcarbamoyladenosine(37)-C(2))-methylthiotransferase MtaB [Lachnospiraceae bacterium]|nr:tRNA (N(6)-L-threonylcarbamoyladenosine(37)-C(2))-methylthiotransferase MtaB [Lachnospiraceae bacterium]MBP3568982.1 tRNA (N(6)-L-threonylcarbamoyladenosine(37)-C(2))-methylthiotransferase MtaB [Lachnospiraceae bacterium]